MNKKPKILIVEDNKYNHELYRDAFEHAGFDVTLCKNADDYFADEVAEIKPDIISMDLMMGKDGHPTERDGLSAIQYLKSDLRTHTIPVMVLTHFFEENKVQKAKELGAVDYIVLSGELITKIPRHYLDYLKNPAHYKASHPLFRKQ